MDFMDIREEARGRERLSGLMVLSFLKKGSV